MEIVSNREVEGDRRQREKQQSIIMKNIQTFMYFRSGTMTGMDFGGGGGCVLQYTFNSVLPPPSCVLSFIYIYIHVPIESHQPHERERTHT